MGRGDIARTVDGVPASPYSITLERGTDGTCLAWVDDLPGCFVRGASREDVEAALPDAIRGFLRWAGEPEPRSVEVEVVAEVESAIEAEEDTEALVAVDREALTVEHWSKVESWLRRSRQDVLRLVRELGEGELDVGRAGTERTLREELEHVALVELMYAFWTFDLRSPDGLEEALEWTRRAALDRMDALAREESRALTSAEWAGAPRPEPWTARKAARRLLWHELLHLRAIERARAPVR